MSIKETGVPDDDDDGNSDKTSGAKAKANEPSTSLGRPGRKNVIKRLPTANFQEYRRVEEQEGRLGTVAAGSWSKMAIVRINRRSSKAR